MRKWRACDRSPKFSCDLVNHRAHLFFDLIGASAVSLAALTIAVPALAQTTHGGVGGFTVQTGFTRPGGAGGTSSDTGTGGTGTQATPSGGGGGGAGAAGGNGAPSLVTPGGVGGAAPGAAGHAPTTGPRSPGGGGGAHGAVISASGSIGSATSGGTGGIGGGNTTGSTGSFGGGGGGAGGYGVVANGAGIAITNSSTISGGAGGNGGTQVPGGISTVDTFAGGGGGDGGFGVRFTGAGTLNNTGTIVGGNGGTGGGGWRKIGGIGTVDPTLRGANGAGGIGVVGSNLNIVNSGTIMGGLSGDGVTRANAVQFFGGTNSLTLMPGSNTVGNVVAFSAADTLALGGSGTSTFDAALIGSQYRGFGLFQKTGSSTWTLTGTPGVATPWTLLGGTLSVSQDTSLGNPATSPLIFNGGVLQVTGTSFTSTARTITWGASGGGFDIADPGNVFTLSQNFGGGSAGGLSKLGAGTLVLNGNASYTGPTNVLAGKLVVGDATHTSATLSGGGLTTVSLGATLGGYGRIAGNVDNFGTVAAGSAAFAGGPMGNFTVGGNYTAHSTLLLNTVLNAGGPLANQFTDRLLILGNTSGHTTVQINASGSGAYTSVNTPSASTGISVVQVAGTSSVGTFTLSGGTVAGGPYQYRLNAYGPGSAFGVADPGQNLVGNAGGYWDYRLQNVFVTPSGPTQPGQPIDPTTARPALAPQVPAYITAPTALFSAGLQDIDQLHRRLGEIRDSQAVGLPKAAEFFARGYGNTMTYQSTRSFTDFGINASESYAAFQLGGSAVVMDSDFGSLRLGLAGSYGKLQFDPNAPDGFSEGNINVGKVSGIATFQSRAGWYLDGIVSGGWFNGSIGTTTPGQVAALNGSMVGASLEGGYPIGLGWQKLLVEPQVQVSWQHLMFDGTTDTDRINVQLGALDQGIVRAGARLVRPFETDDKRFVTPYLNVNLLQGFADSNNAINVSGVAFNTGQYGTAIQVGGGLTGMLTASLAVYGDVSYQHEVSTGGFRGWAFNGGVRYSF